MHVCCCHAQTLARLGSSMQMSLHTGGSFQTGMETGMVARYQPTTHACQKKNNTGVLQVLRLRLCITSTVHESACRAHS